VERISAEDGLDEMLSSLVRLCTHKLEWNYDESLKVSSQLEVQREAPVPILFAFTRRMLSRALHRSAKTSCCAVLSHDGGTDLFRAALDEAERARRLYVELTAPWPADRTRSRRLIPIARLDAATGKRIGAALNIDSLTLHAHTVAVAALA
jgi:hypothetical protein